MTSRPAAFVFICGSALGVVLGVVLDNLPLWIGLGAGVGMVLGFGFSRRERARSPRT